MTQAQEAGFAAAAARRRLAERFCARKDGFGWCCDVCASPATNGGEWKLTSELFLVCPLCYEAHVPKEAS